MASDDRGDPKIPATTELFESSSPEAAEAALLVLIEPELQPLLDSLAESFDRPKETVARALVLKMLDAPELDEWMRAATSGAKADSAVLIPSTSEIYLSSFQEQSRTELRLEFGETERGRIGALAARYRVPPGRCLEVLLACGLAAGGGVLEASDLEEQPPETGGLLARIRRLLGF